MGELSDSYGKWLKSVPRKDIYILPFLKTYRKALVYYPNLFDKISDALLKSSKYSISMPEYKSIIEKHEEIKQIEKLDNKRIKLLEKAVIENKLKNYDNAIKLYIEAIELGKLVGKNNLAYFAHHIERLLILYSKTNNYDKEKELLDECISNYPESGEVYKWNERLSRILGKKDLKISNSISKDEIVINSPTGETLGNQLINLRKEDPEFNFYYNKPDNQTTYEYYNNRYVANHHVEFAKMVKHSAIREEINNRLLKGKEEENFDNWTRAIQIYEELLLENLNNTKPYERLITIYKKLKWTEDEIRILNSGIEYFTNLRANQLEYVLGLADKYGKRDFADDYINQGKKIFHFLGGYELYNPYPIIEKWQVRLKQLTDKLK
ncbi:tetratricopeptide repeat protein [Aquirufa nivalisilvae]|uniref:tetratricopeptide repeat protein n=1 Tax=Aquirufa nivalisilvae TaxID=2516557 RepID=UPI0022A9BA4F|nr:tetratricopeptide repeat protein [Aquirufa nivalisilvae]MCZ2480053.1 tetratricopeptide repeat protein [Aquirufa nivalisilvae]